MSSETLSTTTESVVKEDVNPISAPELTESTGTNGSHYSNGNNEPVKQLEQQEPESEQQVQQEYPNEEDVESAKNNYNDQEEPGYNKSDSEPESFRKVFIGGLSYKTEDDAFKEYFSKFGDIVDCIIMRDREGRSRGFGFVTYTGAAMVDRLMAARPHVLDAREIEPKRAVPREESGKPEASLSAKKLFVGGIREGSINEHDLNEYFAKYGNIIDAVIMKTNEGKFRGFGFVEFDDYDPVDKIVLEKHHIIKGNPVNVEKALPKDQTNRARMAAANYGGGPGGGRGGGGGMRGPPSSRSGGGGGGWGPMGGESNFGGGGGGYRSGGGGYGSGDDYGNRGGPYGGGGGYGGDMRGGGGMMGFGGSAPMGGNSGPGGYGMGGPPPSGGGYDDPFGAFGPPPGYGFGQGYGNSSGGGPMRRGGGGGGGGGRGHPSGPYSRGGGRGGGYHSRN